MFQEIYLDLSFNYFRYIHHELSYICINIIQKWINNFLIREYRKPLMIMNNGSLFYLKQNLVTYYITFNLIFDSYIIQFTKIFSPVLILKFLL